ncbi:FAD/NAD(P)-binding oxidoreductase family protein [Forsythia ovata]|uniref:FAD/NAD(P)-binding oxidoreductase family protein n=1 Tax=Forsythia ovata TaxID=205694 RepID=A0ABD1VIL9_9LAMI
MTLTALSFPFSLHSYPSTNIKSFSFRPPNVSSQQISLDSPPPNNNHPSSSSTGVIVIGAGLAGLAAATRLQAEKIPFLLLDASDAVGGRVRTDFVDGFILDRGFQIFITAYPEAQKLLNYESLNLQKFYSGAQVYYDGGFHIVSDPLRNFSDSLQTLTNPIGSVVDKILIGLTRVRVLTQSDDEILTAEELKTIDLLRKIGFSDSVLDRFFRPFFGGIFFDRELETTSRLFNFIFKCLALGDNTLPANGIAAIPEQLAGKLNPNSVLLNSRVVSINHESSEGITVNLENGEVIRGELGVILAVEEFEAVKILAGKWDPGRVKNPVRSTVCLYFSTDSDKVPVKDPVLFLNGSGRGIVNNMFFATSVAPSYAPRGKALVSVSLIGLYNDVADEELVERVLKELLGWFGEAVVGSWSYLRMYRIEFAQPNQCPPTDLMKNPRVKPGLYICGDYVASATFDGALISGRRAVEALLKDKAKVEV